MKQLKHTNVCELKREFYSKGDKVPPPPRPPLQPPGTQLQPRADHAARQAVPTPTAVDGPILACCGSLMRCTSTWCWSSCRRPSTALSSTTRVLSGRFPRFTSRSALPRDPISPPAMFVLPLTDATRTAKLSSTRVGTPRQSAAGHALRPQCRQGSVVNCKGGPDATRSHRSLPPRGYAAPGSAAHTPGVGTRAVPSGGLTRGAPMCRVQLYMYQVARSLAYIHQVPPPPTCDPCPPPGFRDDCQQYCYSSRFKSNCFAEL